VKGLKGVDWLEGAEDGGAAPTALPRPLPAAAAASPNPEPRPTPNPNPDPKPEPKAPCASSLSSRPRPLPDEKLRLWKCEVVNPPRDLKMATARRSTTLLIAPRKTYIRSIDNNGSNWSRSGLWFRTRQVIRSHMYPVSIFRDLDF